MSNEKYDQKNFYIEKYGDQELKQIIELYKKGDTLTDLGKKIGVGHKFSEKPYTLYSMRSTFIEDHLIKGTDIFLLARIAGHDVKTLMQSYERMDIRRRAQEITSINWGAKKDDFKVEKVVD